MQRGSPNSSHVHTPSLPNNVALNKILPLLDKEKLRLELNNLVAYRKRRLQVLDKLEAELSQVKLATEQINVFNMPKKSLASSRVPSTMNRSSEGFNMNSEN